MAATKMLMRGGARRFQSLSDLHAVKGSQEAVSMPPLSPTLTMAAANMVMRGGTRRFQSLSDLHAVKRSQEAVEKAKEDLARNIEHLKLWTHAYLQTKKDLELAVDLGKEHHWNTSFSVSCSNLQRKVMKELADESEVNLKFKRMTDIVEMSNKASTVQQQGKKGRAKRGKGK